MPFSLCACKEIHMYRPNWIFRCSIVKVFRVILRKPDYLRCSCLSRNIQTTVSDVSVCTLLAHIAHYRF